jgi:hypothetical protein
VLVGGHSSIRPPAIAARASPAASSRAPPLVRMRHHLGVLGHRGHEEPRVVAAPEARRRHPAAQRHQAIGLEHGSSDDQVAERGPRSTGPGGDPSRRRASSTPASSYSSRIAARRRRRGGRRKRCGRWRGGRVRRRAGRRAQDRHRPRPPPHRNTCRPGRRPSRRAVGQQDLGTARPGPQQRDRGGPPRDDDGRTVAGPATVRPRHRPRPPQPAAKTSVAIGHRTPLWRVGGKRRVSASGVVGSGGRRSGTSGMAVLVWGGPPRWW